MKISNGALLLLNGTLVKFPSATGKIGYAIARIKRAIAPQIESIDEVRNNLIKKYGSENENGVYEVKETDTENYSKFIEEFTEILNIEEEYDVYKIKPEEFNLDNLYSDSATVNDYEVVEALLVDRKD